MNKNRKDIPDRIDAKSVKEAELHQSVKLCKTIQRYVECISQTPLEWNVFVSEEKACDSIAIQGTLGEPFLHTRHIPLYHLTRGNRGALGWPHQVELAVEDVEHIYFEDCIDAVTSSINKLKPTEGDTDAEYD